MWNGVHRRKAIGVHRSLHPLSCMQGGGVTVPPPHKDACGNLKNVRGSVLHSFHALQGREHRAAVFSQMGGS